MANKETCRYASAWDGLVRAKSTILDTFEKELQSSYGLSLAEYSVLLHLAESEERRMRMVDLATAVSISKSGATRLVDRLEDKGLIERIPCSEDRRSIWACLTRTGSRRVEAIRPEYDRVVRANLASRLTQEEAGQLANLLDKLLVSTS
jgi:DNA-binding MarR family transcriptional regulator